MSAVLVWTRSGLRRRLLGTLVLVLLVGAVGGVVLAAASGARRTASAYDRMLSSVHAADILVNPDAGIDTQIDLDAVAALPEVEQVGAAVGVFVLPLGPDGEPDLAGMGLTLAPLDDRVFVAVERNQLVSGRQPDPAEPYEVLINPVLAEQRDLEPGDTIPLLTGSFAEAVAALDAGEEPPWSRIEVTVTGIGIGNDEIVDDEWWVEGRVVFTPSFYERHPDSGYFVGLLARLVGGDSAVESFKDGVERLAGEEVVEFQTLSARRDLTNRAIRPSAIALTLFAAVAGLAGLLVVAHALTRGLADDRADGSTLASLGMTGPQRWVASMARVAIIATSGAAMAVAVAVALSPLTPVGVARRAEPDPGLAVDLPVLLIGALAIAILLPAIVAFPAWRAARRAVEPREVAAPSKATGTLARLGAPPSGVVGSRFALESGRGRTAVPVRSTIIGTSLAVAAATAALTFAAGLDHLVETPSLYGWNWDVYVSDNEIDPSEADWASAAAALAASDDVAALGRGNNGRLTIDGLSVPAVGMESVRGIVGPTVADGRGPSADDEIALGARTLNQLGADIGSQVEVVTPEEERHTMTVVGQVVFPGLGTYSGADNTELGTGALVTRDALAALGPDFEKQFIIADLRPGVSADARLLGDRRDLVDDEIFVMVSDPIRPADIVHLDQVRSAPMLLSAVLGAFALATLTHALVTSVRHRRRDLAVLRALGFARRQVGATVAWQATTIAVVALAIGLPLGLAAGRLLWSMVADGMATPAPPVTPALALFALAAVTVLAANLVALVPAWRSGSSPTAATLRSE